MSKHRHERTSWFIGGIDGGVFWCYQCGAIRQAKSCGGNGIAYADGSKWEKPTGIGGENPALKELLK